MSLVDHLRELRRRIFICVLAVLPGAVIAAFFYDQIQSFLLAPVCTVEQRNPDGSCGPLTLVGLIAPFNIALTVSIATGFLLAAPVWLYQLWAFVTPGLYRNERRWTLAFLFTSIPLFFAGAALCYWVLPRAVELLLGFTPAEADNLISVSEYLTILLRLILVFGLAFEIPVFVVLLNAIGVLPARTILGAWRWIVLGVMVFAAVATPTGDPFTMLALAVPLLVLIALSYAVAYLNDRRRGTSEEPDYRAMDDDEVSPLDPRPSPLDPRPSPLDDGDDGDGDQGDGDGGDWDEGDDWEDGDPRGGGPPPPARRT
jgi:sec-independent protein translocase protein TatC